MGYLKTLVRQWIDVESQAAPPPLGSKAELLSWTHPGFLEMLETIEPEARSTLTRAPARAAPRPSSPPFRRARRSRRRWSPAPTPSRTCCATRRRGPSSTPPCATRQGWAVATRGVEEDGSWVVVTRGVEKDWIWVVVTRGVEEDGSRVVVTRGVEEDENWVAVTR
eukprot:gene3804-biopygen9572